MVPLVNIMLGEVVFGGVGSGLYGMLIFVVLSVFIAGLMVGRTPEYLGKKIESYDVKMAMLYVLIFPLLILVLSRRLGAAPRRSRQPEQQRAPRLFRDPLRVRVNCRQQRLRLRRPDYQHQLVQPDPGLATCWRADF